MQTHATNLWTHLGPSWHEPLQEISALAGCRSAHITRYYASVLRPGSSELLILMELLACSVADLVCTQSVAAAEGVTAAGCTEEQLDTNIHHCGDPSAAAQQQHSSTTQAVFRSTLWSFGVHQHCNHRPLFASSCMKHCHRVHCCPITPRLPHASRYYHPMFTAGWQPSA